MGLWIQRILSLIICAFYVGLGAIWDGGRGFWLAVIFSVLPLACIWFGDALGEYVGPLGLRSPITLKSPGFLVRFMGWVVLLMPLWAYLVSAYVQSGLDAPPTPAR